MQPREAMHLCEISNGRADLWLGLKKSILDELGELGGSPKDIRERYLRQYGSPEVTLTANVIMMRQATLFIASQIAYLWEPSYDGVTVNHLVFTALGEVFEEIKAQVLPLIENLQK